MKIDEVKKELKVYKHDTIEAFEDRKLYELFKKNGIGKQWEEWCVGGITGIIIEGVMCTYIWDVERFLEGRVHEIT